MNANASKFQGSSVYTQSFPRSQRKFGSSSSDSRKSLHCNNCKKLGHLIDKCYKLHGLSADFKFTKPKRVIAQVETESQALVSVSSTPASNTGIPNLSPELCTQLMNIFKTAKMYGSPSAANFAGNASSLNAYLTQSTNTSWILDSGASGHMCSQLNMFSSLHNLSQPINVTLPNGQFV